MNAESFASFLIGRNIHPSVGDEGVCTEGTSPECMLARRHVEAWAHDNLVSQLNKTRDLGLFTISLSFLHCPWLACCSSVHLPI